MGYEPKIYVLKEQYSLSWSEEFISKITTTWKNASVYRNVHLKNPQIHIIQDTIELFIDEYEVENGKTGLYWHYGKLTTIKIISIIIENIFSKKRKSFLMDINKILYSMTDHIITFDGNIVP
jgi:hypothetical protein